MDKFDILCSNPTYIINPSFYKWLLKSRYYRYKGIDYNLDRDTVLSWYSKFPHKMFSYMRHTVTKDDLPECYTFDDYGEIVYMFIVVPCGHCNLCLSRKATEWSTRCLCESQSHDRPPYFVTLTYNNAHLPKDGVNKRDVQLFMKRLRTLLMRRNYESPRFVLCAEYGSKSGRPHYHALIWNMPNLPHWENYNLFKRAWSVCVNKKTCQFEPLGYVYTPIAEDGSGKYVIKYITKLGSHPKDKNPTFMTSSRHYGIGYEYTVYHRDEIFNNLDIFGFKLRDKFSKNDRVCTFALPSYFKRILFPCPSTFITKDFKDSLKYYFNIEYHKNLLGKHLGFEPDTSHFQELYDKYAFRFNIYDFDIDDRFLPGRTSMPHNLKQYYTYLSYHCMRMYNILRYALTDFEAVDRAAYMKQKRLEFISEMTFPDISKEGKIKNFLRQQQYYLHNEKI